jgi:hypothetical protein
MSRSNRYRLLLRWHHRKYGPQIEKTSAEGSSIRRAINNALLSFFSDSSRRKERRDAHAYLEVQCWRVRKPTAL